MDKNNFFSHLKTKRKKGKRKKNKKEWKNDTNSFVQEISTYSNVSSEYTWREYSSFRIHKNDDDSLKRIAIETAFTVAERRNDLVECIVTSTIGEFCHSPLYKFQQKHSSSFGSSWSRKSFVWRTERR